MKDSNLYNICITVLEAKYLAWIDIRTFVEIEIDGKRKYTKVKECSDRPFFNEYFVFEVKMSFSDLMSTDIEISMYKPPTNLRRKKFLASTRLDIGTVWNRADHQFYHEWFTLRHMAKEKGFLQCDIRIVASDSKQLHSRSTFDRFRNDDVIAHVSEAVYFIRIYRGGDMYNFKHSKRHSKISVGITFSGITAKTNNQRNTVNPVWNEEFKFLNPLPPAHHKFKLDLIVNNKQVSSISIMMNELSCTFDKSKGCMPTFGPAHKYFYSSSNNSYMGYVIMWLETLEMRDGREDSKSNAMKRVQISGLVEEKHFGFQDFSCHCIIYEVTMLSKHICLSTGKSQALTVSIEFGREGLMGVNGRQPFSTEPMNAEETDTSYCHLRLGAQKPCLFLKDKLPDTRWRLFMTNSLKRVCKSLEENLLLVDKEDLTSQKMKLLLFSVKSLKTDCENFTYATGTTQLDKNRIKLIRDLLNTISTNASRILRGNTFKKMYNETKELLDVLRKFVKDPQDSLPSIVINIWKQNKRIYTCRIPPEDVLFANTPSFCGLKCGQLETIFLDEIVSGVVRKPSGRRAKMVAYVWLGVSRDVTTNWYDGLPKGFELCSMLQMSTSYAERFSTSSATHTSMSEMSGMPTCIEYSVNFDCICYAYIEQAFFEDVSLFDSPSHTKVRVIFDNRSSESHEVFGMQQLVWSELVSTAPVTLYGDQSYYENHPPVIVIEVWQRKKKVSLVGNVCLKADLRTFVSRKDSTDLEYHDILYDSARVGKLLMFAELIKIHQNQNEHLPEFERRSFHRTNPTAMYRLEVYFYGVREMKYQSANVSIRITLGNNSLSSPPILSHKGVSNFSKQELIVKDMILPKSKQVFPLMIINLIDTIDPKTKRYAACCSISDIQEKFVYHAITREEWKNLENFERPILIPSRKSFISVDSGSSDHAEKKCCKNIRIGPPALLVDLVWLLKKVLLYLSKPCRRSRYQTLENQNHWKYVEHLSEPVLHAVHREQKYDWWAKYYASKKAAEESLEDNSERKSEIKFKTQTEPTFEFYSGELEQEFDGFADCLKTFELTQLETKDDSSTKTCICKVKAAVVLYEVPEPEAALLSRDGCVLGDNSYVLSGFDAPRDILGLLLYVHIVQAYNLHARHGLPLNPYIVVSVPSTAAEKHTTYLADQSNPCFGLSFELNAELPKDHELSVKVMNSVRFGKNELIGETKVDLENRFHSKHRARCGLPSHYNMKGFNMWRDQYSPSEILESICEENHLPRPKFLPNCVFVAGKAFVFPMLENFGREEMSLHVLLRWEEIPIVGCKLVREHVETRPLFNPQCPGIIQGYIEMWVDMFDGNGPPPLAPQPNITPREPESYELRVIVYRTCKVYLVDNAISVGYKHSDIYVKCWMLGKADSQSSDVHYKSFTGDGEFNWRFIFQFKYLPLEGSIIADSPAKKKSQLTKIPPRIYLQVKDKERLLPDQFIGLLSLDLRYMIKGATRWWLCKSQVDESPNNTLNLFEERKTRGWWPIYGSQRFKQKNKITGYLEAEFQLLTYLEALRSPVGYGRSEPDGLPEPKRKILKYTFWLLPCRLVLHMIGLNKLTILLFLAIFGVILFFLLGIYAIPSTVVQRTFGGH